MLKRQFDLSLAIILVLILLPFFLIVFLLIKITSTGPAIYWSKRIGKNNKEFYMPKFRTMRIETPQIATHLLASPDQYLIPLGKFLRKSSLDEIPQLYSVLMGTMSFVGPRPALFNQDDLVKLRTEKGIHKLVPGITGWAQINGRDDLPIPKKVDYDYYYLQNNTLLMDFKILFLTATKVIRAEGVSH